MNASRAGAVCLALLTWAVGHAETAIDTPISIRVRAHDAKFIGSGVGEMNVIVEDARSGALLASGAITGGTGDTDRLIKQPIARGARLADDKTAVFVAHLKISRPTHVRIRAVGPLGKPQSAQEISVTTWVIPGHPIEGDGIVLSLPGLIVAPEVQPAQHGHLPLAATVTLMCGCPITTDGLWNAADYEVHALLSTPGTDPVDVPLAFTGKPDHFAAEAAVSPNHRYDVTIWAHDAKTGNTGAASFSADVP